ncbi:unnamed protein product [Mortierella alpina]
MGYAPHPPAGPDQQKQHLALFSVVTKNVPPYTVVNGNPAKILKVLNKEDCEKEDREYEELKAAGKAFENWTPPPKGTLALP